MTFHDTFLTGDANGKSLGGSTALSKAQEWRCSTVRDGVYAFQSHSDGTYLTGASNGDIKASNGISNEGEWVVEFKPDGRACIMNIGTNKYLRTSSDGTDFSLSGNCNDFNEFFNMA